MSSLSDWRVPLSVQPKPNDYDYDLDVALSSVVAIRAQIPHDAFTAGVLGTERAGHGVLIRANGLVLTIGYLITEAESVWLQTGNGQVVPGHALAYDHETGFGLVQALDTLDRPPLPLGRSNNASVGEYVVVGGAGGRQRSVAARIVARQEFAGYWEYVLDDAIFTAPAHPHWGGAALIGPKGDLLGIGSLQLEQRRAPDVVQHINMIVPTDVLKPVLEDLLAYGRPNRPPRPWLGLYAAEIEDRVVIVGLAEGGPAQRADLRQGDIILAVGGVEVAVLLTLFRHIWSLGPAGVEVPLTVLRDGETIDLHVTSGDRNAYLKKPRLH
ncbi:MAG: S1C family serine protease [Xanthobacteraceae bacterium]